jgi:AraC-like DNA-binding protein
MSRRQLPDGFAIFTLQLARIRRFQRFMTLAANGRAAGLGDLAFAAGYADQAHMSREVRRLAGQTPAAVRRQYHA